MPEKKKRGEVAICPNCGAPYQPGIGKCTECGHVFQNVGVNHSAQVLSEKLEKLVSKHKDAYDDGEVNARNVEIGNSIMTFPIPSDKEDLIEFIASLDAGRKSSVGWAKAYHTKYKECILKAQVMFPGDPQICQLIKLTNTLGFWGKFKMWWTSLGGFMKGWLPAMLVLSAILVYLFYSTGNTKNEIEEKILESNPNRESYFSFSTFYDAKEGTYYDDYILSQKDNRELMVQVALRHGTANSRDRIAEFLADKPLISLDAIRLGREVGYSK